MNGNFVVRVKNTKGRYKELKLYLCRFSKDNLDYKNYGELRTITFDKLSEMEAKQLQDIIPGAIDIMVYDARDIGPEGPLVTISCGEGEMFEAVRSYNFDMVNNNKHLVRIIKVDADEEVVEDTQKTSQLNSYYGGDDYQAIHFIDKYELDFNLGNVIKYLVRAGQKSGNEYIDDIRKALYYLRRYFRRIDVVRPSMNDDSHLQNLIDLIFKNKHHTLRTKIYIIRFLTSLFSLEYISRDLDSIAGNDLLTDIYVGELIELLNDIVRGEYQDA